MKDKKERKCIKIDMSIPFDRNLSIKKVEKLSKYKDLEIEVTKMWEMKTSTVPIVMGALGLVKKGFETYIDQIPGHIRIEELHKIALLGSAHIQRRTLFITSSTTASLGSWTGLVSDENCTVTQEKNNNNTNNDKSLRYYSNFRKCFRIKRRLPFQGFRVLVFSSFFVIG